MKPSSYHDRVRRLASWREALPASSPCSASQQTTVAVLRADTSTTPASVDIKPIAFSQISYSENAELINLEHPDGDETQGHKHQSVDRHHGAVRATRVSSPESVWRRRPPPVAGSNPYFPLRGCHTARIAATGVGYSAAVPLSKQDVLLHSGIYISDCTITALRQFANQY